MRTVLLVDDEPILLKALERGLRGRYAVTTAEGLAPARRILEVQRFDAVIADHRMPGGTGSELLGEVGERWPGTVRLLMTGYADIETTIDAVNRAHVAAFLKKPLLAAEIVHALEDAFARQVVAVRTHTLTAALEQKNAELARALGLLRLSDDHQKRALARANQALADSAQRDPLTGLRNRRGLLHAVAAILRGDGAPREYAFLFLDVDHFKRFNDTRGHAAGDRLLVDLSRTIEATLRSEGGELVGRWGGEEIVVFLPGLGRSPAVSIAERLRRAIRAATPATVSVGVALAPEHGTRLADVLAAADGAMYRAKALGRDQVQLVGAAGPRARAEPAQLAAAS